MKYLISVSKPGSYKISLRTAGFESGVVRATLSSENSSDEFLYTFTTPRTNGWQSWQTVSEDLTSYLERHPGSQLYGEYLFLNNTFFRQHFGGII